MKLAITAAVRAVRVHARHAHVCLRQSPAAQRPPPAARDPWWHPPVLGIQRPGVRAGAADQTSRRPRMPRHSASSDRRTPPSADAGPRRRLVISGGSNAGMQTGQRYFVRRRMTTSRSSRGRAEDDSHGRMDADSRRRHDARHGDDLHACDGILLDDYLEPSSRRWSLLDPFRARRPSTRTWAISSPASKGSNGGAGRLMTIDRGSNAGVVVGQRFLVFRDKRDDASRDDRPLEGFGEIAIGQAAAGGNRRGDGGRGAAGRCDRAGDRASKDAIATGDLIAPIRLDGASSC